MHTSFDGKEPKIYKKQFFCFYCSESNVLNPVVDLLSKRYDEQHFTIATTNLTPDEIRGKYGIRLADRFNEMMERIVFTNGTYRV